MNKDLIDNLLKASSRLELAKTDWFIDNPMVSNIINDFLKEERHNIRKEKIKRIFDEKK